MTGRTRHLVWSFGSIACLAVLSSGVTAQEQPRELKLLWLGSSSTKGLMRCVDDIVNSRGDIKIESTRGGGYVRVDYLSEWITDGEKDKVKQQMDKVRSAVMKQKYDVVVLQLSYGIFFKGAKTEQHVPRVLDDFCQLIISSGAEPMIFEHWSKHPDRMRGYCAQVAQKHKAKIAFCGSAVLALKSQREDRKYLFSGGHAASDGNYISACSVYAALTGKSPVGLPAKTVFSAGPVRGQQTEKPSRAVEHQIPPDEALKMQKLAWDVYQKYNGVKAEPKPTK